MDDHKFLQEFNCMAAMQGIYDVLM